jgi:hypothetical protein
MARQVGLVKGEWVAIDGSKFRAVSSAQAVREGEAVKRYLDQLENADQQDEVTIERMLAFGKSGLLPKDPSMQTPLTGASELLKSIWAEKKVP